MRFVIETNIALYLLGGKLEEPIPAGEHLVSVITELELLAYPDMDPGEEERVRGFLGAVRVVGLGEDERSAAVRLRREHRLKLPDAIVAATAVVSNAVLLTNDSRLASLPTLRTATLRCR